MKREEAIGEAIDEHNEQAQGRSPSRARKALTAQAVTVAGIAFEPYSITHTVVLEELEHPVLAGSKVEPKARDMVDLIYIFAHPDEAYELIEQPEGRAELRRRAGRFCSKIPAQAIPEITRTIHELFRRAQPPGADAVDTPGSEPSDAEGEGAGPLTHSP